MKIWKSHNLPVVALVIGMVFGVLLQKYCGAGNLLRAVGLNYQANSLPQATQKSKGGIPEEHQGKIQLFILAGQSNMSGRGDVSQSEANSKIYVFGNDYHWRLASEPVDDSSNQVDKVSEDPDAGFSPALSFAAAILEQQPDAIIGLIPCAKGASSIHEWRRNLSDNALYGSCLKRARAASTMGEVTGLIFFQGEADAADPIQYPELTLYPNQWADKFSVFVSDWRRDLNLPELPVVFAEIGTNTTPDQFPNWAVVQEQQRGVRLPFCAMITTDDLPLKDNVHFTTESYQIIGRRFAEAYTSLQQEQQK
jgi:hypothetical protein